MVWKFESAPAELRKLNLHGTTPHWIALVPAALDGPDLHKAILEQTGISGVSMHSIECGDVVYFGSSDPLKFVEIIETVRHAGNPQLSS